MTPETYDVFDSDVERCGAYRYALPTRKSSVRANRRFSDVIIQSVDVDGKDVVDVGCGDGTYTAVLRDETRAASILGIDPAKRAVELARKIHGTRHPVLQFRHGYAIDLVRARQRFDVAIYRGVIHHVDDPAREIATALRLAAEVFFLEPNGWNPVLKVLERVSSYHRAHGEKSYRLSRYRRWIEAAGGRVAAVFYFGLVPMFAPDWFVPLASGLEPWVERRPVLRQFVCGQLGILARGSLGGSA